MTPGILRSLLIGTLLLVPLAGCQMDSPEQSTNAHPIPQETAVAPQPTAIMLEPEGLIQQIHDPVMAKENGVYYIFSTGRRIPIICSTDKITWEQCGRVFERNPAWTREVNASLRDIWAPDISWFNDRWHLYYSVSTFGTQNSAIGLATNSTLDPESPDYEWVDQGLVLRSNVGDSWNAIDANLVLDDEGEPWLSWGSFWNGLWMSKVDKATGMLAEEASDFRNLADRSAGSDGNPAIEAPFIVKHGEDWFLFASFDQCCQGVASTYNARVGRSDSFAGPYVDKDGLTLTEGGGTPFLSEYGQWKGPGHVGVFVEDGIYWLVYHAYDANQIGIPKLRIETIAWDADGWPTLASQADKSG